MIANTKDIKEKLLDVKYNRVQEGLKIGVPDIDEFIRFKRGNMDLFIGHANVGKTTTVIYLLTLWALKHDLKFLVWSSENTPQSIVRKIIEFRMDEPINTASDSKIEKALQWCNKHFKIIDVKELYTYKDLMEEALSVLDIWQYDGLLLDPYNSLMKDKDLLKQVGGHEYDYQVSSEFRLFAKKHNVTVFINAHGVTEAMRRTHREGDYQGLPMPIGMASVEGGGKWGNRSDNVYAVHRYTSHPSEWMYTHIHVYKVKENESGGRCTPHDSPIKLRMKRNNVGFEYDGKCLMSAKNFKPKTIEF